jgi:glycosyltransferase 2 family protein
MKKYLTLVVGLLVSFGALYFLLRGDLETLRGEIEGGRYIYTLPATVLYLLSFMTRGYRWRSLLGHRTNAWHSFNIMNAGYLMNLLPLRVGELARAWMTTRLDPPIAFFTALSSIVVERILDLLSVLVMLGIALLLLPVPQEVKVSGAILAVITFTMAIVLFYFAFHREQAHRFLDFFLHRIRFLARFNFKAWLDHLLDGLQPMTHRQLAAEAIGWSIASWLLSIVSGYILMLVFFEEGSIGGILLMLTMLALAVAIPSVPGNLGTFEAAGVAGLFFAGVISSMDAPANAQAVAFSLLLHIYNLGFYFVLGMFGFWVEQTSLGQVRQGMATAKEPATT